MPPRRSHTKSRNGCAQCKRRRVKCDERGPPCSNCISREIECSYEKPPIAQNLSRMPASSVTMQQQNAGQSLNQDYQQLSNTPSNGPSKLSEWRSLELMHKYSTETYRSLCNDASDFHNWQIVIPRSAFNHNFLMNGILAVASLHIASTMEPPEALTYINTALEYNDQALSPFRHAIDDLNPDNCDAICAHAVITTVIGIALPHLTTQRVESSSMTENITVVFELLQGVSKIVKITRPWLRVKLFTSNNEFWSPLTLRLDDETEAALNYVNTLIDEMITNAEQKKIVQDAFSMLNHCFIRHRNLKDVASILAWLAIVDKEFVGTLQCRQPLALLVLMYWGALLHELDGKVWWARNSGSALVVELLAELQGNEPRLENALIWPKQKIGLQGHPTSMGHSPKAAH